MNIEITLYTFVYFTECNEQVLSKEDDLNRKYRCKYNFCLKIFAYYNKNFK